MNKFKQFLKDHSGNLTPILGLAAFPALIGAGAAIDMVRVSSEQAAFYAAVDTAALSIASDDKSAISSLSGQALNDRVAQLEKLATKYITANYKSATGVKSVIASKLSINGSSVKLSSSIEIPMTIMSLVGIQKVTFTANSTIKKASRPIELVMVMDTTGSMAGSKIAGSISAAHTLLTRLYGGSKTAMPRSEFIRTALVPFSGAVKLDTSASDFKLSWIDTTGLNPLSKTNFDAIPTTPSQWNNYYAWSQVKNGGTSHVWNGCVEGRQTSSTPANDYLRNDTAPNAADPATLFPAYFNPDVPQRTPNGSGGYTSYGLDYIATTTECTGLSSAVCSSTATADMRTKQENYAKYASTDIGPTSGNGPWRNCAVSKVVPMTYDRNSVEAGIDLMVASGPTVIPEGLAWGWRAISPSEPLSKVTGSGSIAGANISPYNDVRWKKIMVLMTDGDNDVGPGSTSYNNTTYTAYGYGGEPIATNRYGTIAATSAMTDSIDATMATICGKIKAQGITLYVASFGSGVSSTTRTRLQNCATSGTGYYQHAATPTDLTAFFDHVGEDVINKSIYVSN